MKNTKLVWDRWELIAINYLKNKWYKIIDVNFKYWRYWEIDVISYKDWIYIFIEVKYRKNSFFWLAEESLTKTKLSKIYKTIEYYCLINNISTEFIRFDFIWINANWTDVKIEHYKNLEL